MSKRILTLAITLTAALTVPSLASAHTGTVSCTDKGVIFSYQANFSHDTLVTEYVNGVQHQITVPAGKAVSDGIDAPAAYVVAKALWVDGSAQGSIPLTEMNCPNPVVHPDVCIPTETVTNTIYTPGPETIQYVDVPGLTLYVTKWRTRVVHRIKWKTRIKLVPYHDDTNRKSKRHDGGVTG